MPYFALPTQIAAAVTLQATPRIEDIVNLRVLYGIGWLEVLFFKEKKMAEERFYWICSNAFEFKPSVILISSLEI